MNEDSDLRITRLLVKDARRIKNAEVRLPQPKPGKGELTEFFAGNDQGKTTLHDMFKSIFEPGKHPSLIREGCDKALCIMELSDGAQAIRTHEPCESSYDVIGANGVDMPAPATYIKKLAKAFSFDPLAFDEAEPKKQLEYLLSISSIQFDPSEIKKTLGIAAALLSIPGEQLDIATFGKFHKLVTETRAATGRRRDEKAHTVESLRKTMLASDSGPVPRDWKAELDALQKTRDDLAKFLQDDIADIKEQARQERESPVEELDCSNDVAIRKIKDAAGALLDVLRKLPIKERESAAKEIHVWVMGQLQADERTRIAAIDSREQAAIDLVTNNGAADREQNSIKIAEAQAAFSAQVASQANRVLMVTTEGECVKLSAEYEALADAAKSLDDLRKSKLETSFVRGLEVRDGLIYVDGLPWKEHNQAARYIKAMEIVAQGTGNLGFITADKGESLDANSRAVFRKAVVESGLQVLLFSVATPEQIDKYGPELQTIPAGVVSKLELAVKKIPPQPTKA